MYTNQQLSKIRIKEKLLGYYGDSCIICNNSDIRVIDLHHVFGDSKYHKEILGQSDKSHGFSNKKEVSRLDTGGKLWEGLVPMCKNHHKIAETASWWN